MANTNAARRPTRSNHASTRGVGAQGGGMAKEGQVMNPYVRVTGLFQDEKYPTQFSVILRDGYTSEDGAISIAPNTLIQIKDWTKADGSVDGSCPFSLSYKILPPKE